jgi:FkbM family methyltransferase
MIPTPYEILRQQVGKDDGVIFDVGANIGNTVEVFRTLFDQCTVHAFEPHADQFAALEHRLGAAERVVLNNVAIGAAVGTAVFHRASHPESGSLLPLNPKSWFADALDIRPAGEETVTVDTIDHYCEAHGVGEIDLLKLDVQGFETECLRGAQSMLAHGRIRVIQSEVTCHAMYQRATNISDLEALLLPHGYRLFTLFNVHCADATGELLYMDTLYVRG